MGCSAAPDASHSSSLFSLDRLHELGGHSSLVTDAIYSPDGLTAISCDSGGTFFAWNTRTGARRWQSANAGFACTRLAYARTGAFVAATSTGEVLVVDANSGQTLKRHTVREGVSVDSIAISDDMRFLAVGTGDAFIRLIEIASGEVTVLSQHEWPVLDLRFMDQDQFVLAGDPTSIVLWNADSGREVRRLLDTSAGDLPDVFWLSRLSFTDDQNFVLAGSGHDAVMFNMATREVVQRFTGHTEEIVSLRLTPDKTHVITASRDLSVKFWNVDTGAVDAEAIAFDVSAPTSVSVSPLNDQFIMSAMKFDLGSASFRSQLDTWIIRH